MRKSIPFLLGVPLLCAASLTARAATFLPADGVWQFPDANGSGLTLDYRDGTIGIGLYTYDEAGANVWYSGAGQLVGGVLSTTLALYRETAPGTVEQIGDSKTFRLEFANATQATLTFGSVDDIAVHHAAFGADYLGDWALGGATYSMPDLRGRWLFATRPSAVEPQAPAYDIEFVASAIDEDGRVATFRSLEYPVDDAPAARRTYEMSCGPQPSQQTRCVLASRVTPTSEGEEPVLIGEFDPYDLWPNRAVGSVADNDVIGFRLHDDPVASPSPGIWRIADRNGSGFTLDVRENSVAVGIFSYDATGKATWSLAQGPIVGGTLTAPLLSFSGGSCLGCTQRDPVANPQSRIVSLQFIGATRAVLQIGNDAALPVSLLPYGADYAPLPLANDSLEIDFPSQPMPLLSGYWVFSNGDVATERAPDEATVVNFIETQVVTAAGGNRAERITATAADIFAPARASWDTESHWFECATFGDAPEATCETRFRANRDGVVPDPLPAPTSLAAASISDVSGNRIVASGAGDMLTPVWGFRLPPAAVQ